MNDTEITTISTKVWVQAISATVLTSLSSLVGVIFISKTVPSIRSRHEDFFKNAIAFSVGVMLSTVFIHLLPGSNHLMEDSLDEDEFWKGSVIFLSGIFVSILLEIIAHQHSHHTRSESNESDLESLDSSQPIESVAYTVLFGDSFHNFSDGFLIATAFMICGSSLGWVVTASVLLHEIPHEILDFIILVKAGMSVKKALLLNFLSSLPSVIGAIIVLYVNPSSLLQVYIIKFGAGVLTYIALSQLLPSISKDDHKKPIHIFLMLLGLILIGLLQLYHPECEDH